MTKTILLTLVTAVVLMEGCLGERYTVRCFAKTKKMSDFENSMVKLNERGLSILDTMVFDVVPNTNNPPREVDFPDIRDRVTKGCQIELLVKQAEGFNLPIIDENDNPSQIDVGITLEEKTEWLDDLPLLAIAMFRPNDEFTSVNCNSQFLFQRNNWQKYFANTYSYLPLKKPDSQEPEKPVVGNVYDYELDEKIISLIDIVEFPTIKPGVLFVPVDKEDPTSDLVSDETPIELIVNNIEKNRRDYYCAIMNPIKEEEEINEAEIERGQAEKDRMKREKEARNALIAEGKNPDFEGYGLLLV